MYINLYFFVKLCLKFIYSLLVEEKFEQIMKRIIYVYLNFNFKI